MQREPAAASHAISGIFALISSWFVWYFSGPIVSWIARNVFERLCYWFYGGEGWLAGIRAFVTCMSPGEHIGYYAYKWSEIALATLFAPISYFISHRVQIYFNKFSAIAKDGEELIHQRIVDRLESVHDQLQTLSSNGVLQGEDRDTSSRPLPRSKQRPQMLENERVNVPRAAQSGDRSKLK